MHKLITGLFTISTAILCSTSLIAQTTQEYLELTFAQEKMKGPATIIFSSNLCSACATEPTFEGFLFIKDSSQQYKVRYLKYINLYERVKVLKDTVYTDASIASLFKIEKTYQDSIFGELMKMEALLMERVIYKGDTFLREPLMHGRMRYLSVYHPDKSVSTIYSIMDLNAVFERAHYYWVLSSAVNNYINDFFRTKVSAK